MRHCSACGGEIQENMRFCPHCGAGVQALTDQPLKDYWAEKLAREPERESRQEEEEEDWSAEVEDEDLLDLNEEEKGNQTSDGRGEACSEEKEPLDSAVLPASGCSCHSAGLLDEP